ncbi:MAG: hypothetical protein H0W24_01935 [Lysobacter sp.]|nr:hypothetical protein [Lysobacter sp.]
MAFTPETAAEKTAATSEQSTAASEDEGQVIGSPATDAEGEGSGETTRRRRGRRGGRRRRRGSAEGAEGTVQGEMPDAGLGGEEEDGETSAEPIAAANRLQPEFDFEDDAPAAAKPRPKAPKPVDAAGPAAAARLQTATSDAASGAATGVDEPAAASTSAASPAPVSPAPASPGPAETAASALPVAQQSGGQPAPARHGEEALPDPVWPGVAVVVDEPVIVETPVEPTVVPEPVPVGPIVESEPDPEPADERQAPAPTSPEGQPDRGTAAVGDVEAVPTAPPAEPDSRPQAEPARPRTAGLFDEVPAEPADAAVNGQQIPESAGVDEHGGRDSR